MTNNSSQFTEPRAAAGGQYEALIQRMRESEESRVEFFQQMRPQLKRLVELRMSSALASRLDASDVVQEAFISYLKSITQYLESPAKPPETWLRNLARDALSRLRKFHVDTQSRDVRRESALDTLVDLPQLATTLSSVSNSVQREDLRAYLTNVFEGMSDLDREILAMVHFEGRTLKEVTDELELNHETTRKRYRRALNRLSESVDKSQLQGF